MKDADVAAAVAFIRTELMEGRLVYEDLARIVEGYQRKSGLYADGKPGPVTLATLRTAVRLAKVYPLRELPDGRRPIITSGHKSRNPSRPNHDGCDFFYAYDPTIDGPVRVGDGGAARGKDGKPRYVIPAGECARACAIGGVTVAAPSPTGHRVWIEHPDGWSTGYFHLRDLRVKVGDMVSPGTPLGEVGDNPKDIDAEHVHFEVSPVGRYAPIDPEIWLSGATYHVDRR